MEENFTKHEISIGKIQNGKLERPLITGHAFLNQGEPFYTVKLMMFPGQNYYLVKNREGNTRYTVFAKMVRKDEGYKFQNPVGSANLLSEAMYIEIYFPVLRSQMYMSLYPASR